MRFAMKWMKERDLLIAQTMAFVQSVSGKKPDADMIMAAPLTEKLVYMPAVAPIPAPPIPPAPAETAIIAEVLKAVQPPQFAKLDIRGDFGSEVRARVATFRAHQERFLREREEYCSTTMAKVRATLRDDPVLPRQGK
jgi:hypothetical protein